MERISSSDGLSSTKQMLFDELADLVLPADILLDPANHEVEVPQDPRFHMARIMDKFTTRVVQVGRPFKAAMAQ